MLARARWGAFIAYLGFALMSVPPATSCQPDLQMGHATAEAVVKAGLQLIPYSFTGRSNAVVRYTQHCHLHAAPEAHTVVWLVCCTLRYT